MPDSTVPVSIDELRVGATCSHSVEDEQGVLLLGANTQVTEQLIVGLRDRGIKSIQVDVRDLATMQLFGDKKSKRASTWQPSTRGQWTKLKPVKEMLVDRHEEGLSSERAEMLATAMCRAKQKMNDLKQKITTDSVRSVSPMADVSDGFARSIVDDHDQTIGAVGERTDDFDPNEQSVRMSTMGMAIAVELGHDGQQVTEVGTAGLLHDMGLYAMDAKFLEKDRQLTSTEWWEYKKYPNVSAGCIGAAIDASESVQLAIQQIREQFDGSGYPRGLKKQRIHISARILNVVDSYLRLTSSAGDRKAIVPHDALGLILHLGGRGLYDPQVIHAFLSISTLFPLGSCVELSNDQRAQVIRRPKSGFAAPVLMSDDGVRIEMESANLKIVRPSCDSEAGQMRLMPDMMLASMWHPAGLDFEV